MIRREGDPILERVCEPFPFDAPTADRLRLVAEMRRAMESENGQGLAAPQIGVLTRAFVIATRSPLGLPRAPLACFNPSVVVYCDGQERREEGCLSYPGVYIYVRRWRALEARFQDERGTWVERRLDGAMAHAYQHELDHLDGRTLKDFVPAQALVLAKAKAMARRTA